MTLSSNRALGEVARTVACALVVFAGLLTLVASGGGGGGGDDAGGGGGPKLVSDPPAASFVINAATVDAALTQAVGLTSSSKPLDWEVTGIDVPWLSANPTIGQTGTQGGLSLLVAKDQLPSLASGNHPAMVTLSYGPAGSTRDKVLSVPVTLSVSLPKVTAISPYYAEAGKSLSHVIIGEGFSNLQPSQPVNFGDTTLTSYEIVSDTEIWLDAPALSAGPHDVRIDNALGLELSDVTFHSVTTPSFADHVTTRNNIVTRRVLYDPLRIAVYSVDSDFQSGERLGVTRYRFVNGAWQQDTLVSLPLTSDAAISADGQTLYVAASDALYSLDLDQPGSGPVPVTTIGGGPSLYISRVEVMNDETVLLAADVFGTGVVGFSLFDPASGEVRNIGAASMPLTAKSLDGRRALVGQNGIFPPNPVQIFDASAASAVPTPVAESTFSDLFAINRDGQLAFVEEGIYDEDFNLVAALDLGERGKSVAGFGALFSHDGSRLYAFQTDYITNNTEVLKAFDVGAAPVAGQFPLLGETTIGPAPAQGGLRRLCVQTPDGKTIIGVDDIGFRTFSLPPGMQ